MWNAEYGISANSFRPCIVSSEKMSFIGEFAVTIWICYNLQIQKRIVSAETIWGNKVFF